MIRPLALVLALAGCAGAPPAPEPRSCPPLPELRAGASSAERRIHTQTIVRLYVRCAEGPA